MRPARIGWILTHACRPGGARWAAMLPRLDRVLPATPGGADQVRELCEDERWSARYVAGRALGRMAPDVMEADEAWERLLVLAADESPHVREAVPVGMAALIQRVPAMGELLERLLTDPETPRLARRAGLRSLVLLTPEPATRDLGASLLRKAALTDAGLNRGVGSVIVGRGIAARDPDLARRIAREWSDSPDPALRRQGDRALRGPLAEAS